MSPPPARWSAADLEDVPACPACGAGARRALYSDLGNRLAPADPTRWRLVRCARCAAAWLDPRPAPAAIGRAYAGGYHTQAPPGDIGWVRAAGRIGRIRQRLLNGELNRRFGYALTPAAPRLSRALALVPGALGRARSVVRSLPAPRAGDRLLDVGCGNGQFLLQMRGLGWEGEGIEPDPAAAVFARRAGFAVKDGPLTADLYPPGTFSAVTLGHVIEHVPDPPATLTACRAALRPGGRIWIATPNLDSGTRRVLGRRWFGLEAPRHLVIFSRRSLRRVLAGAGFTDIAESPPIPTASSFMYALSVSELPTLTAGPLPSLGPRERAIAGALDVAASVFPALAEEIVMTARVPG